MMENNLIWVFFFVVLAFFVIDAILNIYIIYLLKKQCIDEYKKFLTKQVIDNNIEEQGSKNIFDKINTFLRENPDWIPYEK